MIQPQLLEEGQGELWDELHLEHHWFHIVRSMLVRGQLAEMGANAWAVYCVIKAHTSLSDGRAWPSQSKIATMVGLSVDTVSRATDRLIVLGLVSKRKKGNHNEYFLIEKVPMTSKNGTVVAFGNATYVPLQFEKIINQMKEFAKSGGITTKSPMHITLNMPITIVNQGANSTFNINNVSIQGNGIDESSLEVWAKVVNKINNVA